MGIGTPGGVVWTWPAGVRGDGNRDGGGGRGSYRGSGARRGGDRGGSDREGGDGGGYDWRKSSVGGVGCSGHGIYSVVCVICCFCCFRWCCCNDSVSIFILSCEFAFLSWLWDSEDNFASDHQCGDTQQENGLYLHLGSHYKTLVYCHVLPLLDTM